MHKIIVGLSDSTKESQFSGYCLMSVNDYLQMQALDQSIESHYLDWN